MQSSGMYDSLVKEVPRLVVGAPTEVRNISWREIH